MASLKFALRSLLKTPGFTLIAIVTLGLGIGANTSMFSLLNTLMLRPPPFPEHEELSRVFRRTTQNPQGGFSPADYRDLKPETAAYGEIAAYAGWGMSLSEPGTPADMVNSSRVSPHLFTTLGFQPQLGRNFRDDEVIHGNHRVLIISHNYWQERFGGTTDVIGRMVRVDGESHEIVGVLPAEFNERRFLGQINLFRPLGFNEDEINDRNSSWLNLIARRGEHVSPAEAEAFLAGFGARMAEAHPEANAETSWFSIPLMDTFMNSTGRGIVTALVGLSGFVLLIACSNLANFLLARTMARAREFSVRSALGASRSQLLRPIILESLVLALVGGLAAILVAIWTSHWFVAQTTTGQGSPLELALDWRVLSFAFVASLVTAVAFALAPALFALKLDINGTLKSGGRGATVGRGHQRIRNVLIIGQFALAMVLLAGAALFIRGAEVMHQRQYGWESAHVVTGTILLPAATYVEPADISRFHQQALEQIEALPGVQAASLSYGTPFFGLVGPRQYLVEGRDPPPAGQEPGARINGITPHYFEATGTRLLNGRVFNVNDTENSPPVAIINEDMARGLFGDENPIGRRVARTGTEETTWIEIIGVVGNIQTTNPTPDPIRYQLYRPMSQEAWLYANLIVRTSGVAPATVVDPIRATMTGLNPDLPVRSLMPADTRIAQVTSDFGLVSSLLSAFAVLGLALAALGIYGVIARTMAQRTGEFGIRLALGAQVRDITRIVLSAGVKLAIIGAAIGIAGAIGIERLIAVGLPGMHTNSIPVLVGVTLVLVAIALVACYLPARRASKINPVEALRAE